MRILNFIKNLSLIESRRTCFACAKMIKGKYQGTTLSEDDFIYKDDVVMGIKRLSAWYCSECLKK